jgi:predicted ester cyclase
MIQANEPVPVRGHDALLKSYQVMFKAMPDWKVNFSLVAFHGDTIIFEGVGGGTFTGPMSTPEGDIAPTGKKASLKFAFFAKINPDGLIAEDRTYFDNMEYMKQLGVIK